MVAHSAPHYATHGALGKCATCVPCEKGDSNSDLRESCPFLAVAVAAAVAAAVDDPTLLSSFDLSGGFATEKDNMSISSDVIATCSMCTSSFLSKREVLS